jgi:hypothetical protein
MLKLVRHFGIGCEVRGGLGRSAEDRARRTESDGRPQAGSFFVFPGRAANAIRGRCMQRQFRVIG